MTLLLMMFTMLTASAKDFVTDVMVIGNNDQTQFDNLQASLEKEGWTAIKKDLNAGCGSGTDYIYLLYKTTASKGNSGTIITDFYIKTGKNPPANLEHGGRTYYLVPCQGSENFVNSNGDLNRGASGDYIYLYYTKDDFSDFRCVTGITINGTQSGAVGSNGGTTGYDLNTGCGLLTNSIYMHFSTESLFSGSGTSDDPFIIGSTNDWENLATYVSRALFADKCYQLSSNISVSSMVGTDGHPFRGIFDGNGKTLTVSINSDDQGTAPFHYVNGATIKNLTVSGTVSSSNKHAAGLVGFCSDGTNTVSDCNVTANVNVNNKYAGGIVGHGLSSTLSIENSVYSGTISGFTTCAGGLLGWCDNATINMENCLFKGSFTPGSGGKYHPVACKGPNSSATATVATTYYLNTITTTAAENNTIVGAEGIPVSGSLIEGTWDLPVTAADGITYYIIPPGIRLPYSYGFENNDLDAEGWTKAGEYSSYAYIYYHENMSYTFYTSYDNYLISPEFDGRSSMELAFRYFVAGGGQYANFCVGYSTTTNDIDAFSWYEWNTKTYTDWQTFKETFPMGTKYVAIHHTGLFMYLDDFEFKYAFHAASPVKLSVGDITLQSAKLTWEKPSGEVTFKGYAYQYKKEGDADWSDQFILDANTLSVTISGLTKDTDYRFRVKAIYDEVESHFVETTFTTLLSLPYEFGFENGMDHWSMVDCYEVSSNSAEYNFSTRLGENAAYNGNIGFQFSNGFSFGRPQYLISPQFVGTNPIEVSFYYKPKNPIYETFQVGYSTKTNDISDFTWGDVISENNNNSWKLYENIFPAGTKYIAVKYTTTKVGGLYIDDFRFVRYCEKPTDLALSSLTKQSATMTWKAPQTDDTVTGYAYQYKKESDAKWSDLFTLDSNTTSVTISGLTRNIQYLFRIKALCGDGESLFIETSFPTLDIAAPTDLTVSNVTEQSTMITWKAPETTDDIVKGYAYQYQTWYGSDHDWSEVKTVDANTTSVTVSGLINGAKYSLRVKALYADGESDNVETSFSTPVLLPYEFGFDNGTTIWSYVDNCPASKLATSGAHGGKYGYLFSAHDCHENGEQYLISPQLVVKTLMTVSFYYQGWGKNEKFQVGYSTKTNDINDFIWGSEITIEQNFTWTFYENTFPADTKYIAIKYFNNVTMCIDDFCFVPYVAKPTKLVVSNVTEQSAQITWTAPETDDTVMGYIYQYKESDSEWSDSETVDANTTSVTISRLTNNRYYSFRVKALYAETESWFAETSFSTAVLLPYEWGFENGLGGFCREECLNVSLIMENVGHDGDFGFQFSPSDYYQYLISPQFTGTTPILVSFFYRNIATKFPETFQVGYSTTTNDPNAFNWGSVITASNTQWTKYENNFPVGTKFIAIKFYPGKTSLYLDDFSFVEYSAYAKPIDLTVGDLTDQSANFTWTKPETDDNVKEYVYQYKEFTDEKWSAEAKVNTTSVTLNGLSANTDYDFRVKALYADNNASNYSTMRFLTEGPKESLPHYQGFENGMGGWRIVDGLYYTDIWTSHPHSGNNGFIFDSDKNVPAQYLISPQLNGSSIKSVSFWYQNKSNIVNGNLYTYPVYFEVGYSTKTKNLSDFTWEDTTQSNFVWLQYTTTFPANTKYIAVKWVSGSDLYLDDFNISEITITIDGDVNQDGKRDYADVNAIVDIILSGGYDAAADLNNDKVVNIADIVILCDIIKQQ